MNRVAMILAVGIGLASPAYAQTAKISDDVVKIGVMTDMSGQFSHESGEGSVTAVKMAVEDFGETLQAGFERPAAQMFWNLHPASSAPVYCRSWLPRGCAH